MKHYKTPSNDIRAIERGQEFLIQGDWEILSSEEFDALLNPPESIEKMAVRKGRQIESSLKGALAEGMPYTMPDGTDDVVQTRPEDEPNLLGLAIEARDLRDAGETEAQLIIRAKSNRHYALTPQQMIDLTDAAKAFKKLQLAHSWIRKGEIKAALEAENRDALEAIDW